MIVRWVPRWLVAAVVVVVILLAGMSSPALGAGAQPSFQAHIQPIIEERCVECHRAGGDGYEQSGLDLTTYAGLMKGTRYGPVVVPGDAFTSNLNVLIEGRADRRISMPFHDKPLSRWQKVLIRRWVNDGAKDN